MSSTSTSNSAGRASNDQSSKSNDKRVERCASCGIKEDGDIKLKICTACKSVRYCGVECQKKHRPKHKKDCKKRAAELHDEILFKQPDCCSHEGDCPICFLPLPHHPKMSVIKFCCSHKICIGCSYANLLREEQLGPERKCPFCRSPAALTPAQELKYRMKRIKVNCPVAIRYEGLKCYRDGKYEEAFDYYTKASKLGDVAAHFHLATLYLRGKGVEKDEGKQKKHLESAAIGGHFAARFLLSKLERDNGNDDRAAKHLVITAKQGCEHAIGMLTWMSATRDGVVSEDVLADALRGYQEASDAMKSPQRDAAEAEATRLGQDGF